MTYTWLTRKPWLPSEGEQKVVHQIMGECIDKGFGVRQIAEAFNVREWYIYKNVPVKKIWRSGKAARMEKELGI